MIRQWQNPEYRKKMIDASKKNREKQSPPFLGKTHTEESNKKRLKALKGRISPTKGMLLSKETKKKQSEARKKWWAEKKVLNS